MIIFKHSQSRINNNGTMIDLPKCKAIGSTEYYWYYDALQISDSIDETTGFSWQLLLSLIGVYGLITICMIKGIETAGKVDFIKSQNLPCFKVNEKKITMILSLTIC